MVEYGVNVTNKFAFLSGDEDEDPAEVLKKAEQARKQKAAEPKTKKVAAAPAVVAAAQTAAKNDKQANKENQDQGRRGGGPRKDQGARGGGGGPRGPRRDNGDSIADKLADLFGESRPAGDNRRPPGSGRDERPRGGGGFRGGRGRGGSGGFGGSFQKSEPREPRTEDNTWGAGDTQPADRREAGGGGGFGGTRTFGGGRGRGRGGGGGFGGPRGDRQSGSERTGVKHVDKRGGQGAGNWGDIGDQLAGETEPIPAATEELNKSTENAENAPPAGETEEVNTEHLEPEEEKPKELTLEEWKAQHKTEKPQFNVRKPDESALKKLVPLKRDTDDEDHVIEEIVYVKEKEKREKPLNIEVSFSGSSRSLGRGGGEGGGRGRGGGYRDREERGPRWEDAPPRGAGGGPRGGGGGYRGAGGPGPSGRRQQHIDLNNQDAFPALGSR